MLGVLCANDATAFLDFKWIVFISEAYKFLESINGTTEMHQITVADFWPDVQISVILF